MTEPTHTDPTPLPEVPRVVMVTTYAGQLYQLGEPYPEIPAEHGRRVGGTIVDIVEEVDEDDPTGSRFLCRIEPGPAPGYVWRERIQGAAVSQTGRVYTAGAMAKIDEEHQQDPEAGIDVRRVQQRIGAGLVTLIFEVGRPAPDLPGLAGWLKGRVTSITRTGFGLYFAQIAVEASELVPDGSVLTVSLADRATALEVLSVEEADEEERQARLEPLEALRSALGEDDDEEEGEDEGSDDEEASGD